MSSLNEKEWINIYRNIESVVLLFSCNSNEKSDLIHDALLHVHKRLKTNYQEKGKFDVWVKKVTLNFCKDAVANNTKSNTSYYEELYSVQNTPYRNDYEKIKDKMAVELINEAILELKVIDQEIIRGRLNKESYASLAGRFQKNKKTIIKHCNKSFIKLRKSINQKFYEKYGVNYREDNNSDLAGEKVLCIIGGKD